MTLSNLLKNNKKRIAAAWMSKALTVYSDDARRLYGTGKDKFDNPVGQTLSEEMDALLDAMTEVGSPEVWASHLTRTLKIRAVQDMRPSEALAFVFHLKSVLPEALKDALKDAAIRGELERLDANIDAMALFAFEIYAKHREKVLEVRISDVKRQVSHLLKRSAFFTNDEETDLTEKLGIVEPQKRRLRAPKSKRGGGR